MSLLAILLAGFVLGLAFNAYMALALSLFIIPICLGGALHIGPWQALISTCLCVALLQFGYVSGAVTLGSTPRGSLDRN
jgi:hypothetical protein